MKYQTMWHRREFIRTHGKWLLGGVAGSVFSKMVMNAPRVKTSCNFYSFNEALTSGAMTTEEAIDFCAKLGFDGVDITGYYFSTYPQVPNDTEIYRIKGRVLDHGMRVSGTGVRNDFGQASSEGVAADLQLVKDWIIVAAKLGAPMIRIFAGRKLSQDRSRTEAIDQILQSFRQCIDFGKRHGIVVTYQNHNDIFFSAAEVREIMEELHDPWFGLNLDIGSLRTGDPYEEIKQLIPYARNWQVKEHVYRSGIKEPVDMEKLGKIIREGGFQGYVPLETLPPSDPMDALPGFLKSLELALSI